MKAFGEGILICIGKRHSNSDGSDLNNMSKKDLALQQAMDQLTSIFGKGSIMWLGHSVSPKNVHVVSSGSFALDIALGIFDLLKVEDFKSTNVPEIYACMILDLLKQVLEMLSIGDFFV